MGMDHFFLRPPQKLVCFSYHPSSFWRSQFWPIPKYRLWLNQQKTMACTIWATSVGWLWLIFHCVHKKHALNPWISVCVCVVLAWWFWILRMGNTDHPFLRLITTGHKFLWKTLKNHRWDMASKWLACSGISRETDHNWYSKFGNIP